MAAGGQIDAVAMDGLAVDPFGAGATDRVLELARQHGGEAWPDVLGDEDRHRAGIAQAGQHDLQGLRPSGRARDGDGLDGRRHAQAPGSLAPVRRCRRLQNSGRSEGLPGHRRGDRWKAQSRPVCCELAAQYLLVERLHDVLVRAGPEGGLDLRQGTVGGAEDDHRPRAAVHRPQRLDEGQAIHPGHVPVHHDQLGQPAAAGLERVPTRAGLVHAPAQPLQDPAQHAAHGHRVVDDEAGPLAPGGGTAHAAVLKSSTRAMSSATRSRSWRA